MLSKYKSARSPQEYQIQDPDSFVDSMVNLLNKISRVEILLYLLVITDELLDANPEVAAAFISKLKKSPEALYQSFFR